MTAPTEIRIPKTRHDLRIKHMKALKESTFTENPTLIEKVIFLSDLTGVDIYKIRQLQPKNVEKLYNVSLLSFIGFKLNDSPPQDVTLDGKEFELIDPNKVATGWHIDFGNIDYNKDPVKAACMFYYPKGHLYGEVDDNNNLINPIADRYETMRDHLELQIFLEASAFFLRKSEKSMRLSLAKRKGMETGEKIRLWLSNLLGKKQSTT